MNLQIQQNMNNQTTSPIQDGVTKSPTAAVAQLDDNRVGLGTFVALKEACGKNKTCSGCIKAWNFKSLIELFITLLFLPIKKNAQFLKGIHSLHIYPLWLCRIEKNFSEPIMVFPERRCFLHLFADLWHEVALQPVSPKLATVCWNGF